MMPMKITNMIISLSAYILGTIIQMLINEVPSKYIPIQNIFIYIIGAYVCCWPKIKLNFLQEIFPWLALSSTTSIIINQKIIRKIKAKMIRNNLLIVKISHLIKNQLLSLTGFYIP